MTSVWASPRVFVWPLALMVSLVSILAAGPRAATAASPAAVTAPAVVVRAPAVPPRPTSGAARKRTAVRITAADHANFGRVVLDAPGLTYTMTRDGQRLLIRFTDDPMFMEPPPMPRNVLAWRLIPSGVELTVPTGAIVHDARLGTKVVIDVDDVATPRAQVPVAPQPAPPVAEGPPASALTDRPTETGPKRPVDDQVHAGEQIVAAPESLTPPRSDPGQLWPVTGVPEPPRPVGIVAFKARPSGDLTGVAIQLPFPARVGAALFSRGSETLIVFDERRPIDLSGLHDDPVFGSALTFVFPAATVIRLTRPTGASAILSPSASGWRVSVVSASPRPTALRPVVGAEGMILAAEAPGHVVSITDPRTGGTLLVGTQRASGQSIVSERRTPEFRLPVTGQGVVVEPLSDAIGLRITVSGFVITGGHGGLALSPPRALTEVALAAAGLTREFEFPRQTTENLVAREKRQAIAAAVAPPLARGPLRFALAESLVGLGMGVEAQTLLRITVRDAPREASSPAELGLAAIAALIAGRPKEAGELADTHLDGTDEIALWRAIETAMADEGSPKAAAVFATTAPMLLTYPAGLLRRVLPLALETMILGGEAGAAAPLLAQRENDPQLAYARALLKQAKGDNDGALTDFDTIAKTRSQLDHARAAARAVELRLATGKLDSKGAADALERLLYAWRGDERDLTQRLRIADLRAKTGDWRTVFARLREAKSDFPAYVADIDRRLKAAFAAVPRDPSLEKMPPTELIALLEENAELMADGPDGEPMRVLLAEKLMALDLPKRADPLLTRLMRAAPYGPARAGFGATLATLRLHEGDGDGALLALSESNSADMGDAVRDRRTLIIAKVEAQRGRFASAIESLSGNQSLEAEEARAAIFEQAKDWPAARDALATLAAGDVPNSGPLTDAQLAVLVRLATAATFAGDDATLASLRDKLRTRPGTGPQADLLRLLIAAPVRGTADLGRARAEMGLARAVTADISLKKSDGKRP